jgi:predicted small secreted protein
MKRIRLFPLLIAATCVFVAGCSSNPATGGKNVVVGSWEGEKKTTQKNHQEIVKALGLPATRPQEWANIVANAWRSSATFPNENSSS